MEVKFTKDSGKNIAALLRRFGGFISQMIAPNISIFIAWGLMASLFLDNGWIPGTPYAALIRPISIYLIPPMVAFMGGKLIDGYEGGVIAALAAVGLTIRSDTPMFFGAMMMGPLSALINRRLRDRIKDHIPKGFEMLVINFLAGIIGLLMCLFSYSVTAPVCLRLYDLLTFGISKIVDAGLLPLLALFNEPAKAVFLNNVIDQGAYYPLGMQEAALNGKSILFMIASNPGAGLGLLAAFSLFGTREERQTAPGALLIHFFGGIHEMYIPYLWSCPATLLGMIAGSAGGIFLFSFMRAGLTAGPSPGSFFSYVMLTPRHDYPGVLLGIGAAALISFFLNSFFLRRRNKRLEAQPVEVLPQPESMESAPAFKLPEKIIFACDLGLGSSVMGAVNFRKRLRQEGITIPVTSCAVEEIPPDTDLVITQQSFMERVRLTNTHAEIITVTDFLTDPKLETLYASICRAESQ